MNVNRVKAVLKNKKGNVILRYFDQEGKLKQKSLDLPYTKRNKQRIWRDIVPVFELELEKKSKESLVEKKVDARLSIYCEKYKKHLISIKHSKYFIHKGRIKKIEAYFGSDTDMNDISELQLEEFFQNLTCSRTTKLDWLVVVRKIFELARKANAIKMNLLKDFKLPIQNDEEQEVIVPFTPEEIKKVLVASDGTELHNYFGISLHIGSRPEETIALKITDIDFDEMVVHISKAITNGLYKSVKTDGSKRVIPLPTQAVKFFKSQIDYARSKKSEFLFSFSNGARLNDILDIRGRKDRNEKWYKLIKEAGIEYKQLRQTRHTFAVQAIKSGKYTFQEVSAILGHTSLRMLFKHYGKYLGKSHLKLSREIDIFDGLGDFLGDFDKVKRVSLEAYVA